MWFVMLECTWGGAERDGGTGEGKRREDVGLEEEGEERQAPEIA